MGNWISGETLDMPKKIDFDTPYIKRIIKAKEEMNGWERVEMVFSKDEFGEISPEMHRIKDATLISMFVGASMGAFGRSRIAYMDFFRQNVHTVFETPLQAKKQLSDKVILGMGSGAFRIGWRISLFTFMYMTASTCIAAYRGKLGLLDQVGGAGLAGYLYKFRDGPRAAVSGAAFGSLLGLGTGSMVLLCMKVFGMDFEKANTYYYHRLALRQEKEHRQMAQYRENNEETKLEAFHKKLLALSQESSIPSATTTTTTSTDQNSSPSQPQTPNDKSNSNVSNLDQAKKTTSS